MKFKVSILLFILLSFEFIFSQTPEDSITIAQLNWEVVEIQKGITRKHVQVSNLYNSVQNISIVEVDLKYPYRSEIIVTEPNMITSLTANSENAIAAINGSYFNIKKGNSVAYLKIGKQVLDTTIAFEFAERVNGAIFVRNGKLKLKPWEKDNEKKRYCRKTNILASGPLMLHKGEICDFSSFNPAFIKTKHPRSAVCITKDKKLLLVAVDGRFKGQAEGINIPELTHLLKMLGGKDAINLDGGGSTTLWVNESGVINKPSDNRQFDTNGERPVANIITIKSKK